MSTVLAIAVAALVGTFVGLPLYARLRGRALQGKALPPLPGPTGERLSKAGEGARLLLQPLMQGLQALHPRFEKLSRKSRQVFLVNVIEELELAKALRVMGTPSVVEIADGKVVGYHVGAIPEEVVARFG